MDCKDLEHSIDELAFSIDRMACAIDAMAKVMDEHFECLYDIRDAIDTHE